VTFLSLIGILGVGFYLTSYAMLQTGVIRGSSYTYTLMNMLAASCVLLSLIEAYNLSSMLIQIVWMGISVIGLARMAVINRRPPLTENEMMLAAMMPGLTKADLTSLLDQGDWVELPSGTKLTCQGVPVDHLYAVATGNADVMRDWRNIAEIRPRNFIGEMTCLNAHPATATVVTTSRMLAFRVEAEKLRRYVAANAGIRDELERSFAADLRLKLADAAGRLATLSNRSADAAGA